MPIYEYVCTHCGNQIEKLQGMSDAPLTDCAACGESALKRKVSAPSFRLAGDGWYETDFKKEGRRHLAGDHKHHSGSSTQSDSDSAKSESKPKKEAGGSNDKSSSEKSQSAGAT